MHPLKIIKTLTHVLLTVVIILFIISGFGITNYQIIQQITAGMLSKPTAFQIHSNLIIPLIVLLVAHLFLTLSKKFR
jgi:hypothetical protein